MHGAIRTYRVTGAEGLSLGLPGLVDSRVGDVPGVVAHYVLETGHDSFVSVTICESEAALAETAVREAGWVQDAAGRLEISGPTVIQGPVPANGASTTTAPPPPADRRSYRPGDWG